MTDNTAIPPATECLNPSIPHPGNTSDGFHTFDELYMHRVLLTAALFNAWALPLPKRGPTMPVVKSKRHSSGELCFGGGWFIVVATLPTGQISYHYEMEHWDLFDIQNVMLPPTYDGHTPQDVIDRLSAYLKES